MDLGCFVQEEMKAKQKSSERSKFKMLNIRSYI
jgi:hypothetical protein